MKKVTLFLATALLLCVTSCQKGEFIQPFNSVKLQVTFNGFSIQHQQMKSDAKGRSAAEVGVSHMAFAVFNATDNSKVMDTVQDNAAELGNLSVDLKSGTYILVAVGFSGTNSTGIQIASPTLVTRSSRNRVDDIFTQVDTITIGSNAVENITMTLNRAVSAFRIKSTTPQPSTVNTITIKVGDISGTQYQGWSFNPNTSLSTLNSGYWQREYNGESVTNYKDSCSSYDCYVLLGSNPETLDVHVSASDDKGNVLYEHTFDDVSFAINRYTIATGPLFDIQNNFTFSFNDDWDDPNEITF